MGILDDAAASSNGCGQAMLGLFPRDRDIDVHRVPQGFRRVEVLHPDRRAVPEWVDGMGTASKVTRVREENRKKLAETEQRDAKA